MTGTQPRLSPCQLPWVGKCMSNSGCTPIRATCASNKGISSTRSLRMVKVSFIPRPYHNVQNPFKFERTVRYTHGSLILKLPSKNWKFSHNDWKFSPRRAKNFQGCVSLIATNWSFSDIWDFPYYEKI